jgi:glucose-1-phosphate thymidylyltransferase
MRSKISERQALLKSGLSLDLTAGNRSWKESVTGQITAYTSLISIKALRWESHTQSRALKTSCRTTRSSSTSAITSSDKGQCDAVIALQRVSDPERYGVAEVDKGGRLIQLVEKPQEPKSDLALVGVYLFTTPIFNAIRQIEPSWRNELEITDAIQRLIDTRYVVKHHVIQGWWKDTGMPEDILEVNRLLLDDLVPLVEGTVEKGAVLKGRVSIGKESVLKRGCTVFGPTIIGEHCTIDAGTYIGPYTSIGDNTYVSGAHIEDSIVIGASAITCRKTIVESLIGDKTQIRSTDQKLPKGHRLIVGSGSSIDL